MTDLRDAEEWARETAHANSPHCQGHMFVQEYRNGAVVGEPLAVPHDKPCSQITTAITRAIHEARREMQEKCAIFCESHSPAWHSNELLPQRGSLTHDGHRYATAIRSIPIGDEEKNDD